MNEYMELYIAEAKELLDEMNGSLLKLDKNIGDTSLINSIFRDIHTIKGNSASMGFKKMENLSHSMEDVLQDIREGKVEVDTKIMELLFVCHDFLESGICTIMQTGNEEEMNIDGILSKLHFIIGKKHEKMKNEAAAPQEQSLDCSDLILNNQELYSLKKDSENGLHAYLIKIKVSDSCILKTVRLWMWFQEMDSYLKVIKSDPNRPSSKDIKNNSFVFEGSDVTLLVVSEDNTQALLGKLNKLLDVENIYLEAIELKDTDFAKNQIKLVMTKAAVSFTDMEEDGNDCFEEEVTKDNERLIEIESELSKDFLEEILVQLTKLDAGIQALKEKSDNNTFYKLSRLFHTIKGLAGFIDNRIIVRITDTAEQLLEYYRKGNPGTGSIPVELFEEASALIRTLCQNYSLTNDEEFIRSVENYMKKMRNVIPVEEVTSTGSSAAYNTLKEASEKSSNQQIKQEVHLNLPEEKATISELHNQAGQELSKTGSKSLESSFMRISTQKIDSLVDMLGELIIMHSLILKESSEHFDSNDKYMNNLLRMSKIIKEVQNLSMSLRMVSLKQTLQKTMRVGRDTAAELVKKADIIIKGEETEIDRNIADKLLDPLMHLIRNSISHGIEEEEERVRRGKPQAGQVHIRAYSKRGYVYIEVEDDGKGLSLDRIHSKAVENNLIDPNKNYTTEEIMKFIFLPGFSTKETVDNISGRGVGMNIVETEIKKVGGKIDIINREGEGCTFVLKIPLNLAVMNGTIVDILGDRYIIPTIYIKQFMKPEDSQWVSVKNKKTMLRVRDEIIQVIPIDNVFDMEGGITQEDENMVIILEVEQKFKAIPVRSIIGRQEIVAKPLEKELNGLDFISGASILGDGKVSLILDVESMFKINNY